jgi:hypothetical protein
MVGTEFCHSNVCLRVGVVDEDPAGLDGLAQRPARGVQVAPDAVIVWDY